MCAAMPSLGAFTSLCLNRVMFKNIAKLISCVILAAAIPAHAAQSTFHITGKEPVPGDVRWDYLSFDVDSNRLYITHGDHVDVYDTGQNRVVATIPGTEGVHGVALAPDLDRGFTSNGASSTVTLFELSTSKVIGTLPTEKKPDAIVYDPHTHRVFVANGDSGTLTVIDAQTEKVIGTVAIGGKLEFEAVDGKGLLYVNIEDQSKLAVVDTVRLSGMERASASISMVVASWVTRVPESASPSRCTGTSTVTFSPRFTTIRSMCSRVRLTGWVVIALDSANSSLPSI